MLILHFKRNWVQNTDIFEHIKFKVTFENGDISSIKEANKRFLIKFN